MANHSKYCFSIANYGVAAFTVEFSGVITRPKHDFAVATASDLTSSASRMRLP
jgi:hypothetical protein